jgi:hypothetical protein
MRRKHSLLFPVILVCLSATFRAEATTYTVKPSGGNYTTIQACANVAAAGDTCTIYAGTYAGWTQSKSGSSGSPITFTANTGNTITVTSSITISSVGYITISYLALQAAINGDSATNHCIIDHNTATNTPLFANPYVTTQAAGAAYTSTDNVISNNTVTYSSPTPGVIIQLYGNRNRIENNTISGEGDDCMDLGGANVVVRGNYCYNVNGTQSSGSNHIDFVQNIGGAAPTLTQSLIEHNVEQNCTNDAGNCHFVITRTNGGNGSVGNSDNLIIRYNYAQNMDGMGFDIGGVGDDVTNAHIYNNTVATEGLDAANGAGATLYSDSCSPCAAGVVLNNIFYDVTAASTAWSPVAGNNSGDVAMENGNLTYDVGYAGNFGSPYSTEATYAALHSKNPNFANYPTDGTLQAGSPAIGAAVALTTVASSDSGSGTSLIVNDARFFQPGWGDTNADWIRVGSSTTVQISAINYTTNTITLVSGISRSSGNPVYLYKDSAGNVVLPGANPDIGAYPYSAASAAAPAPPTNLAGVGH